MTSVGADRTADVVVVGAGAAGLAAATFAAARSRRVLLLEKKPQPGLKILISGGGRCNVTTTRSGSDLEQQYGMVRGRFLRHALRAFPPVAVREWFLSLGVPLQEEDLEKLFPVSQKARDVLEALLRGARNAGAELITDCSVTEVRRSAAGFSLTTNQGAIHASALVLATGGRSYTKTGTTGDGYRFCTELGHTVTATFAALAPLVVDAAWLRELQGIVVTTAEIAVLESSGKVIRTRRRPILFTHHGLSGPAPMDLAGDNEERNGAFLRLDFAPDVAREELDQQWLNMARTLGRKRAEALLPRELPERLRVALCELALVRDVTLAELTKDQRARLLTAVKDLRVRCDRSRGFEHAEVTRGGVSLDEISASTMASKLVPNLFCCGELLDLDGPIGGFNFQSAFATGRLAGMSS